jgi:hypothetical protein
MVVLLTGPSRHSLEATARRPRPANVDAGGFPRRRRLSCAKERPAQHGNPRHAHRIIKGTVSSRGHLRAQPGGAVRPGGNPRSAQRQDRQNLTADLPRARARAHPAPPAALTAAQPVESYTLHAADADVERRSSTAADKSEPRAGRGARLEHLWPSLDWMPAPPHNGAVGGHRLRSLGPRPIIRCHTGNQRKLPLWPLAQSPRRQGNANGYRATGDAGVPRRARQAC